jgi:hydroxylamine reductase
LKLEATAQGIIARRAKMNNNNSALGVREMAMYGIKGTMAYFNHAERIYKSSLSTSSPAYSSAARDQVFAGLYKCLAAIAPENPALGDMVAASMKVGEVNFKVMELLDGAHSHGFGHQEPTVVSSIPFEGKCILVSGHDIVDLYKLLQKTEGTGINVYTQGEMLPAHAYPALKKFKHLKGHYGHAWQKQRTDFARFPGAILLTSNCLMEPLPSYEKRVFSCNSVGSSKVHHLKEFDFGPVIECAQHSAGFKAADCHKKTSTADKFTIGFGHHTVLSVADQVLDAVHKGHLKNMFVIGGCDGSEGERNYFTKLGEQLPQDSIALTLGCGKFRINGHEMGNVPNTGIPRLLDFGQCNDSYGAVKVALTLAQALNTDINSLPLHFAVSWFEQKAVAVLLTLLHLNVQNIYLGPNLPAFITPDVLSVLVDKFKIHACNTQDASADLKQMLARSAPK